MRYPPGTLQNLLLSGAALLACVELVACGDFCFSGVINNPNGVIITTKNASPPPACPPSPIISTMNVAAVKSQICETCTASSRAQHIFVTLKSIQLHSVFPDPPNTREWLELAPQFLREPRQIDLLGDSIPVILVQNAPVPAGTYREVVLQFLPDTPSDPDALPAENSCGHNRRNCMLMADGRVEELHFTGNGDSPELLLPLQYNGSSALAVVPGATVDLRFKLHSQQVSAVSPSEGWQIHYVLVGSASVSR
jgi:hypothetical protein